MQFCSIIILGLVAISCSVVSQNVKKDVLFHRLGSFEYANVRKTYWVPRYMKAQWYLTRSICNAFDFEILTLDTLEEMEAVSEMCESEKDLFGWFVHIGGVAATSKSKTSWYWVDTNQKVSYKMPWQSGQPDFGGSNEWCLSLAKNDGFKFNDIPCHGSWEEKFICESEEDLSEELKNKKTPVKVVDGTVEMEQNKDKQE